jgi:hypothetical protein
MLWLEGRAREGAQEDAQRPWWRRSSESRRIMQEGIEQNALELLHAIREHHPDIYAGAWINPYTAALEAGLDPDSTHYRVAMEYLQAEDVLEEAEESRELGGGGPLYTITLRGMEMLREV